MRFDRFPWIRLLAVAIVMLTLAACAPRYSETIDAWWYEGDATVAVDSKTGEPAFPLGTWNGYFRLVHEYTRADERDERGPVTFVFEEDSYRVDGQRPFLPPTGWGEYAIDGDRIHLEDTAMHTANFDWTLILKGEFEYDYDGERLLLIQWDRSHDRYREIDLKLR